MKVGGSRASDQFSRCVHVRGDTCECKTRASERTNERNERTAGRDTTLGGTTFRRLSRARSTVTFIYFCSIDAENAFHFLCFFFRFTFKTNIERVCARARARAQHTRDKFFPSRTRSIVRKRKKERKERKMERRKSGKGKEGRGRGLFAKTKHYRLLLNRVVIAIYRKRKKK